MEDVRGDATTGKQTVFVGAGYLFSYLSTASIFEWTNPLHYDKTQVRHCGPSPMRNPYRERFSHAWGSAACHGIQTERSRLMWRELELGLWMMFFNVAYAVSWLWLVDPHTPVRPVCSGPSPPTPPRLTLTLPASPRISRRQYYGYYATHEYTAFDFFLNLAAYMFFFDSWFYWTHRVRRALRSSARAPTHPCARTGLPSPGLISSRPRTAHAYQLLHLPWMWKYVHHIHHQFLTPTPFAQDAVHPIEGIVQGPMGHHIITLFVPIHPVAHALFGFLTSVYAIGAHDGTRGHRAHSFGSGAKSG